ncbi:MAG: hypothetical protein NZ602_13450 [Thermoguttaceae bacterium]|nr:hypothetical protein [Thermoguttaceae bacterium]MDW8037815.1 hypothetical protein [Thermoguttaceae bacterium]
MPDPLLREPIRRYQAPEENGGVVVWPDWAEVDRLLPTNRARLAEAAFYDCQGKPLGQLMRLARQELLQQACQWTRTYHPLPEEAQGFWLKASDNPRRTLGAEALIDPPFLRGPDAQPKTTVSLSPGPERIPMLLAGHQPQLFHPGVWLKNFALDRLAQKYSCISVNLIIDHDVPHNMQIRTPTGMPQQPRWVDIPLDAPAPGVPYEDRPIIDWATLEAFGTLAYQAIAPLVPEPMLRDFWPDVLQRAKATGRLGAALAQARHLWEIRWGSRTLEVPFSRLCQGEAFLWFVGHLLGQIIPLHKHYNTILMEYRRQHRIRNPAQPVPNLRAEDGWMETPLWVWTAQEPIRRPLFVRPTAQELILSDRAGWKVHLPIGPQTDLAPAVAILQQLVEQGLRLRPKALLTTLWARLALGELFIHGIGGARYDQITDELIRRWLGLEPPAFLVLSGTLYLPVDRPEGIRQRWLALQKQLRDLTWHPEWFLNSSDSLCSVATPAPGTETPETLAAEKWRWIQTPVTPENARARFLAIRRINQAMQAWLGEVRQRLLAEQSALQAQLQTDTLLRYREWPFCYYPIQTLQAFFRTAVSAIENG